jgi:hypothetical protein
MSTDRRHQRPFSVAAGDEHLPEAGSHDAYSLRSGVGRRSARRLTYDFVDFLLEQRRGPTLPLPWLARHRRDFRIRRQRRRSLRDPSPLPARPPRLLDRVRDAVRARHFSRRTEKAYVHWTKRYIFFHGKRHPAEMGAHEVTEFLTSLAVRDKVAASTQNQALSALLFLYRHVLGVELPWLDDLVRAKRRRGSPSS